MPDPTTPAPEDLPIQPTGSGVADTEIARMQAEIAEDADAEDDAPPRTRT